jgi:hypothetical protein
MVVILTLSTFVMTLDISVVTVALPVVASDLDGTLDEATWTLAGFVHSFLVFLLLSSSGMFALVFAIVEGHPAA